MASSRDDLRIYPKKFSCFSQVNPELVVGSSLLMRASQACF